LKLPDESGVNAPTSMFNSLAGILRSSSMNKPVCLVAALLNAAVSGPSNHTNVPSVCLIE